MTGLPVGEGKEFGGGGDAVMGRIEPGSSVRRRSLDQRDRREEDAGCRSGGGAGTGMGEGGEFDEFFFDEAGMIAAETGYKGEV